MLGDAVVASWPYRAALAGYVRATSARVSARMLSRRHLSSNAKLQIITSAQESRYVERALQEGSYSGAQRLAHHEIQVFALEP